VPLAYLNRGFFRRVVTKSHSILNALHHQSKKERKKKTGRKKERIIGGGFSKSR
jgi:hypothetical protein